MTNKTILVLLFVLTVTIGMTASTSAYASSKVITGDGPPPSGLGVVGDLYIDSHDTTNLIIYKKTTTSVWTNIGNFQGPQGPAGVKGQSCWDLNNNGVKDIATEDKTGDGVVNALDCKGQACWDLNNNGVKDVATEDKNSDGLVNYRDCTGLQGSAGTNGKDGHDGSSCTINGNIVSCTDGTSSDVKGPKGDTGPAGPTKTILRFNSGLGGQTGTYVDSKGLYFNNGESYLLDPPTNVLSASSLAGVDGNLTHLRYHIGIANSAGNTVIATVFKNGISTSASCSLVSSSLAPSDCAWDGSIAILEGDLITIKHYTTADGNFGVSQQVQAFVTITTP